MATAADSLAAILARSRLGIATAAPIRITPASTPPLRLASRSAVGSPYAAITAGAKSGRDAGNRLAISGDIRPMLPESGRDFVTALDDDALAAPLARLIRDPSLRQELGADNRAKAEREFDQAVMFQAWAELLQSP